MSDLAVHRSHTIMALIKVKCCDSIDNLSSGTGSREILYRVELPYMEELTLVYLEKDGDEDTEQLSKSMCANGVDQNH